MIDLHSHILPGIDDGAGDLETSLAMARTWAADGVSVVACTPHILPGMFHNSGPDIRLAVERLQGELDARDIALTLVTGADNHVVPDFAAALRRGHLLSLADSRYVLVEPPHVTAPPRLGDLLFSIAAAGYTPILTHPERLTWIETHYEFIAELADRGVWMQVTAGALTGAFGRRPKYWGERMLCEGRVHILATDAHDMKARPPILSQGYACAARLVGDEEAGHLVYGRPLAIIENHPLSAMSSPKNILGEDFDDRASQRFQSDFLRDMGVLAIMVMVAAYLAGCSDYSPSEGRPSHAISAEGSKLDSLASASAPYFAQSTPGASGYRIGPLDVLEVSVFKVPDMTQSVQVADNGAINLPLVGDIQAAGKTPSALEAELRKKLDGTYLKNPSVRVFVKEFNSSRVTVDGAVKNPGVMSLKGTPTLMAAITLAGGLDRDHASTEVIIFRANANGMRSAARIDLDAIRAGNAIDPTVEPGDVIVVQDSAMKNAYQAVKSLIPLTALGTAAFMAI